MLSSFISLSLADDLKTATNTTSERNYYLMSNLTKYFAIYLAGMIGIWKGIPVGIALDVNPYITASVTATGSITTILIFYFSGEQLSQLLLKKYNQEKLDRKKGKFVKWMDKYGTFGLGVISTGLLGPIITVIFGMLLISRKKVFITYMIIGSIIWSFGVIFFLAPLLGLME